MALLVVGSRRPKLLFFGAVATFPGETRFKGTAFRGSFESAGPIISAYASHTLECMSYHLFAPQTATAAEVLLLDARESPTGSQEKGLT